MDVPEPPPTVLGVEIRDHGDRLWPSHAAPRRPRIVVTFSHSPEDDDVLFLFASEDLEAVRDDLARRPLLVAHERARVPATRQTDRHVWTLEPDGPLEAGATYAIGLADWTRTPRGEPFEGFVRPLTIAVLESGASVQDAWPPDGAAGVPTDLTFAALRFDDHFDHAEGITLESERGPVRLEVSQEPCRPIGWEDGTCARLTWRGALLPATRYRLHVSDEVVDRAGASIGPFDASFTTSAGGAAPPVAPLAIECAPDESPLGPEETPLGCVLADDDRIEVRAHVGVAVRAFLDAPEASDRDVAPRGEVALALAGLGPDRRVDAELTLVSMDGSEVAWPITVRTHPRLLPLTLTEVRANAGGPEPVQEYVEVLNYGEEPVSLRGVAITDRPDRIGDVIDEAITLPAGARALLVADAFDPRHPDDVPVPAGVTLIRIGSSLASGGLSNAGEALFLRDAEGRRLSSFPAVAVRDGGVCAVRDGHDRSGDAHLADCTPGTE